MGQCSRMAAQLVVDCYVASCVLYGVRERCFKSWPRQCGVKQQYGAKWTFLQYRFHNGCGHGCLQGDPERTSTKRRPERGLIEQQCYGFCTGDGDHPDECLQRSVYGHSRINPSRADSKSDRRRRWGFEQFRAAIECGYTDSESQLV